MSKKKNKQKEPVKNRKMGLRQWVIIFLCLGMTLGTAALYISTGLSAASSNNTTTNDINEAINEAIASQYPVDMAGDLDE